jgi:hypothetical protein
LEQILHPHRVANEAQLVLTNPFLRNHDTPHRWVARAHAQFASAGKDNRRRILKRSFPSIAAGLGPSALAIRIQQAVSVQNAITVQHPAKTSRRPNVTSKQRATMPPIDSPTQPKLNQSGRRRVVFVRDGIERRRIRRRGDVPRAARVVPGTPHGPL